MRDVQEEEAPVARGLLRPEVGPDRTGDDLGSSAREPNRRGDRKRIGGGIAELDPRRAVEVVDLGEDVDFRGDLCRGPNV
jgi:hypothetical protein